MSATLQLKRKKKNSGCREAVGHRAGRTLSGSEPTSLSQRNRLATPLCSPEETSSWHAAATCRCSFLIQVLARCLCLPGTQATCLHPTARRLGNVGVKMRENEPTCRICHSFLRPYKFIVRIQARYLTSLLIHLPNT